MPGSVNDRKCVSSNGLSQFAEFSHPASSVRGQCLQSGFKAMPLSSYEWSLENETTAGVWRSEVVPSGDESWVSAEFRRIPGYDTRS